ncbi:flagellar hook-associated protein FlgK [Marinibactrum halimedae]|uniref:Flagellar hook-associated protein 1 n=1 Tax=Marinibactrum halimedae TaxID=1444977 RepID=A0AA37TBH1_9GAMM|nr:flagellar hook-associated protein FlgK [Marinibactrum halimedae]MCD9458385.1 flagellar hook-associated protein FlgK [Marinibactrum halimedae]GLS26082.1 flagellar hook-associated protein FlgK [Marinibactrum halimedae]
MSLIGIALSGLRASQTSLSTTGHNITNATTEGYSRQRTEQSTQQPNFTGSGFVGNGVTVDNIDRLVNRFINEELRIAGQNLSASESYLDQASQLDRLLAAENTSLTLSLERVFASLSSASEDPASVAGRQLSLSEAGGLADRFNLLYGEISQQNNFINNQTEALVAEINQYAANIAALNDAVALSFANNRAPNDLLDERDQAIRELSELVGILPVEQDDGTININLGTGQPLVVSSDVNVLRVEPSLDSGFQLDVALSDTGVVLNDVISGGQLGGLLSYQDDLVIPALNELGRLAIVMSDSFNQQQAQGIDSAGNFGVNIFTEVNTTNAMQNRVSYDVDNTGSAVFEIEITDSSLLSASDYTLRVDSGNYEIVRLADRAIIASGAIPLPATLSFPAEGFDINVASGAVANGDDFFIAPVRNGADEIQLVLNEPTQLAFASPLRAETATFNRGEMSITQPVLASDLQAATQNMLSGATPGVPFDLVYNEGASTWDVANLPAGYTVTPANIAFNPGVTNTIAFTLDDGAGNTIDIEMSVSGRPENGDEFSVSFNTNGVADNRNVLTMVELQTADLIRSSSAVAGPNQSLVDTYGQLVETVGVVTAQKQIEAAANQEIYDQAFVNREQISGVNLDEEASNLILYEQAYNASAQVISVARDLFNRILEI